MMLVIDNYDSFTYNLVQYLGEMGVDMEIHRNDQISVEAALARNPERVLISPGPCSPREAGLSNDLIQAFADKGTPLLGVCLGHQCIAHVYGATIEINHRMMHGKTSLIHHRGEDLFYRLPSPFPATRYHSLVANRDSMPDCLEITAWTDEQEIMGLRHRTLPIWGVQFHPESILTENGRELLANFVRLNTPGQLKPATDAAARA